MQTIWHAAQKIQFGSKPTLFKNKTKQKLLLWVGAFNSVFHMNMTIYISLALHCCYHFQFNYVIFFFFFMESFRKHKSGRVFNMVCADSLNNKSFKQLRKGKDEGKSTFQDVAPPVTSSAAIMYLLACLAVIRYLHSWRGACLGGSVPGRHSDKRQNSFL